MSILINLFVDICLLRAGPQDLPSSGFLFKLTAVLGVVTGTIATVDSFGSLVIALFAQILDLFMLLTLLYIGLTMKGYNTRFYQSATALFGTGILINLLFMPLVLVSSQDSPNSFINELAIILIRLLVLWALVVMGHIVRHTFDIRLSSGILIALTYFLFINLLVVDLLPQT